MSSIRITCTDVPKEKGKGTNSKLKKNQRISSSSKVVSIKETKISHILIISQGFKKSINYSTNTHTYSTLKLIKRLKLTISCMNQCSNFLRSNLSNRDNQQPESSLIEKDIPNIFK